MRILVTAATEGIGVSASCVNGQNCVVDSGVADPMLCKIWGHSGQPPVKA